MSRVMTDCRRFPSESNCSLVIVGEQAEVERAALEHAVSVHGHTDSPELRAQLHQFIEPAENYTLQARPQEAMPV
jgi:hypothetical protein